MNIYQEIQKYFDIRELVDQSTFNKLGQRSWRLFDPRLLECLLWVREGIGKPITVNNWSNGGTMSQRGLRTNMSPMVKKKSRLYLSAHMRGAAVDFDVSGMTAPEVREWIKANEDSCPHKVRLENLLGGKPISWVHLDVDHEDKNPQVYLFNV